jgi:hypothetical protein
MRAVIYGAAVVCCFIADLCCFAFAILAVMCMVAIAYVVYAGTLMAAFEAVGVGWTVAIIGAIYCIFLGRATTRGWPPKR